MKKVLSIVLAMGFVFVLGCKSGSSVTDVTGVYEFDTKQWTAKMKEMNPDFSKTPPEMVNKMLEGFKKFSIEVKDGEAVANFGDMVVNGKIEKVSDEGGTIKLKMTPSEEDKKDQPILLMITGTKMVAGPEDKPKEWLYFKKK